MNRYDTYQLENDFNYNCDFQERRKHINKLNLMKTREEQEDYMEYYNITSIL